MMDLSDAVTLLRKALDDENISYGELMYIDDLAEQFGIEVTEGMMAGDILDALEGKAEK